MFNRIFLPAALAGVLSALVLTLAQHIWVTPLILQAETYEDAAQANVEAHETHHAAMGEHHHEEAWQPENGWQRTLSSAASNSVMGIGFALILCGMYTLRQPSGAAQGIGWGLAGYFIFFAAPAIGLPPDLPGTAAAELAARQHWWLGTAVATAAGLGLIFLQPRKAYKVVGVLALAIPHLIGAPHPALPLSLAPETLQTQFRLATIFINAVFWLLLGVISAAAFRYFSRPPGHLKSD